MSDLASRTRDFIREIVIPAEPGWGEHLADAELQRMRGIARDCGIFAPQVPAEYGGLGLPLREWSAVFQAAGYSLHGPAILGFMAPDEGNMRLLELAATPAQKQRYLAPLARGEVRSCFAMTEPHPGAGSDPDGLQTHATRLDGGWSISGEKRFISGADGAAFAIVMARTDATDEHPAGATLLLTPMDAPGIRIGPHIGTFETAFAGGHPYVTFENVFVADDDVLGTPGGGFLAAQVRLGPARLTHCMRWLGLARRAHDIAVDRSARREIFGSRIADLGVAQALLADNVIDIETADAIIDAAAAALEADPRHGSHLAAIAKVHCSEVVDRVIDRAVQLCGGDGVTSHLPLIEYLNEARAFRIYDGSNETHRWAIARRDVKRRDRETAAGAARLDEIRIDTGRAR